MRKEKKMDEKTETNSRNKKKISFDKKIHWDACMSIIQWIIISNNVSINFIQFFLFREIKKNTNTDFDMLIFFFLKICNYFIFWILANWSILSIYRFPKKKSEKNFNIKIKWKFFTLFNWNLVFEWFLMRTHITVVWSLGLNNIFFNLNSFT